MPDETYDLNNDGTVSTQEYFISRRFDKNKDGRLEPNEYKLALNALNNNYESNFIWGLEKTSPSNAHRTLQIRGKIVYGENFLPIAETYPLYPSNKPLHETLTELKAKRKCELKYFTKLNIEQV